VGEAGGVENVPGILRDRLLAGILLDSYFEKIDVGNDIDAVGFI